jgi:hypothetical protein
MSAPINSGAIAKLLWPGLNKVWGKEYTEHPVEYTGIFDMEQSSMQYEEEVMVPGFGLAPIKTEGGSVSYTGTQQGYTSRYTHVEYALGFIVTRKAIDDNQYEKKALGSTADLAFSFRQTKENVAANVLNRAFNSSYLGGDGVCLLSASHTSTAGTWSNVLATAADLSEAALEDLCVQIAQATNDTGMKISLMPKKLIIHPSNMFEATRILKSVGQNDTANNAVNALRSMGIFSEGAAVNHYLTDADAFFIKTNARNGLKGFTRIAAEFAQDKDFDTDNLKYKGYERYSFGWTDPRGLYGTSGA